MGCRLVGVLGGHGANQVETSPRAAHVPVEPGNHFLGRVRGPAVHLAKAIERVSLRGGVHRVLLLLGGCVARHAENREG
jgi:hypothetical protein